MLLCAVKGVASISVACFPGFGECGLCWAARLLGGGQDRDGPLAAEGKLLGGHMASRLEMGPGTAGESFEGQQDAAAD
jgi:hypothetical protein